MRTLFIGSGEIALPTLEYLHREHQLCGIVAQPDKPAGRKQVLLPPATKVFGMEHGIPVLQPKRIRNPEAVAEMAALQPELIVVMAYGQILPSAVLEMAPKGCFNLHASILPKYRGAAPIQAALEAGERETGMTVMWMDEGLDTGDILLIRALPIRRRETGGSLHDRLALLAPEALADAVPMIQAGVAPRQPQDNEAATYAAKLSRESGIIDWSASAGAIDLRVRAMNPWPSAATSLPAEGGAVRRLKVFSVIRERRADTTGFQPGEVMRADPRGLLVAAGSGGGMLLREVQLEGKRRMQAGELLRGNPVAIGTKLGEA